MNYEDLFGHAVARVKVLENKLVDNQFYNRMVDAQDSDDVFKMLSETDYGSIGRADARNYEEVIYNEVKRANDSVMSFSPDKFLTGIFYAKYDFENLKAITKGRLAGEEDLKKAVSPLGFLGSGYIENMVNMHLNHESTYEEQLFSDDVGAKDLDYLSKTIKAALIEAFNTYSEQNDDPQMIDLVVDKALFSYYLKVAEEKRAKYLIELVKTMIDLSNIQTFVRLKNMGKSKTFLSKVLIPSGFVEISRFLEASDDASDKFYSYLEHTEYYKTIEEGIKDWGYTMSTAKLESLCDKSLRSKVDEIKYIPTGYEPVLGYLLKKEQEANTIRLILIGKVNKMPSNVIKERLGGIYA